MLMLLYADDLVLLTPNSSNLKWVASGAWRLTTSRQAVVFALAATIQVGSNSMAA